MGDEVMGDKGVGDEVIEEASRRFLADADATEQLARALARTAPVPAVVLLHGDLGAG